MEAYKGNVRVILTNLSDRTVEFNTVDSIVQVLFEKNRMLILSRSRDLMTVLLKEVLVALAQQEHKKMSKIVVEDFNVCNKFVEKVRLMLWLEQKKYVDISHNVFCSDFLFFISYDHKYVHIKTFISDILQEATESELFRFGWKVHQVLVEEKKYVYYSLFEHQVDIIFTAE